eukprot:8921427-Pyramimonas_sp.AAC.1
MCRPLRDSAVKPPGEGVVSICSDDIVDDFDSGSVGEENQGREIRDEASPKTMRKSTPPARPRGEACPPAQPGGTKDNDFSPNNVVSEVDVEMEAGVEIRGEEITARKRAAEAAFRD